MTKVGIWAVAPIMTGGLANMVGSMSDKAIVEIKGEILDLTLESCDVLVVSLPWDTAVVCEKLKVVAGSQPLPPIVFISTKPVDIFSVTALTKVGICGILSVNVSQDEFGACLLAVKTGNRYFDFSVVPSVERWALFSGADKTSPSMTQVTPRVTPRENEIWRLLAEGNSIREIAMLLDLSSKTIEAHKYNLMRKLDVHNKAQLVVLAIQRGVIVLNGFPQPLAS